MRRIADQIIQRAIAAVLPDTAVKEYLAGRSYSGRVYLVAVGKAAWRMASAAVACDNLRIEDGIVLTKYGHVEGDIPGIKCLEAGHPVPDENGFRGTERILDMTEKLTAEDTVLFLLSGGGSALFEKPLVDGAELADITGQLLACGADITEMNTIRKRLSAVKGGRFALHCAPARIETIILSDVVGDPADMIASGPTVADTATVADALHIATKYNLQLSDRAKQLLQVETPKQLTGVTLHFVGNVHKLCVAAAKACEELGFQPTILTEELDGEAATAGRWIAGLAVEHAAEHATGAAESSSHGCAGVAPKGIALIAGGETVVHLTGSGKGGRNQEIALSATDIIDDLHNICVFSVGSDGTDGPTDAAGGYVDGETAEKLRKAGLSATEILADNDAYNGLHKVDGLVITGPTGTNVNDVTIALIRQ